MGEFISRAALQRGTVSINNERDNERRLFENLNKLEHSINTFCRHSSVQSSQMSGILYGVNTKHGGLSRLEMPKLF